MSPVQKYRIYLLSLLIGSVYILLTEGWERWSDVLHEMSSLSERSSNVLGPDEASKRTLALHAELASLRASLSRSSKGVDQSEAGLVELVGELAKRETIRIETLAPTKPDLGGGLILSVEILGSFHRIAGFLNTIENSPVVIKIEKLEMSRDSGRALRAKLALKATFLRTSTRG